MPDFDDSLGGQTLGGDNNDDRFEKSLGDEHTMGGDTDVNSLGDASTLGDANIDDDLLDDGIKLEDLSERYTEEGVLGKGGMGEVLLATDTRLDRQVAIKRILGKAARSKTASQRFLTEAKSIAALNHNNIVQIYDYGRSTDGPFLIMECVQGGSLLDKCKEGPIELEEAVNIFSQLCDGLAKAHAANIIHRDIKPANVLMTEDGVPKLTDFGLAKDDTADTGMTMEGAVIGTLDFMPPEQREGAHLTDHRSDLWSLAATFYQMLTGKSPKVINLSAFPANLQPTLGKSLEENKEDRYQSALEMKEAVQQAAASGLNASRDLGEGECPGCGTINPSDRKFCRNPDCAASLEVECLSCKSPMPMWEAVCGSCGDLQKPLIDAALVKLQSSHDQAESHLQDLEFDKAAKAAATISGQTDLRLQKFASWHEEFTGRLEQTRDTEHERLREILLEATAHEKAYDYEAGLRVLEQVAPSLKNTGVDGNESAEIIRNRIVQSESKLNELVKTNDVVKQEANELLKAYKFEEALSCLRNLEYKELPQLLVYREWATTFENQASELKQKALSSLEDLLNRAVELEENYNYSDAIKVLDEIDRRLFLRPSIGGLGDAGSIKKRLQQKRSDLKDRFNNNARLKTNAIHFKASSEFKKAIEEASKIQNDHHPSLQEFKLWRDIFQEEVKGLIHEREIRLAEDRGKWQPKAIKLIELQRYKEALLCLENISEEAWNGELGKLRNNSLTQLNRLTELRDRITKKIQNEEFRTILPEVEECLSIKADQEDLVLIRKKLIKHNQHNEERNKLAFQQTHARIKNLEFGAAKSVLEQFEKRDLLPQTAQLLSTVIKLQKQHDVISDLRNRKFGRFGYNRKLGRLKAYERLLSEFEAVDPQITQDRQTIFELKRRLKSRLWSYLLSIVILTATYLVVVELIDRFHETKTPAENSMNERGYDSVLKIVSENSDSLHRNSR